MTVEKAIEVQKQKEDRMRNKIKHVVNLLVNSLSSLPCKGLSTRHRLKNIATLNQQWRHLERFSINRSHLIFRTSVSVCQV